MDGAPRPEGSQDGFSGVAPTAPSRRIAEWIPAGMNDWPGKVSTTLLLSGCTFDCPYCRHRALRTTPPGDQDDQTGDIWNALVKHLHEHRSWLDGVVVSGGEPTDDPDLISLLAAIADEGFPVKLDTNGHRPDVLAYVLAEDLAEYVALEVKAKAERYAEFADADESDAVAESVSLLVSRGVRHEFRTTLYPGTIALDDLPAIAAGLRGGMLYALQQYRPDRHRDLASDTVEPYPAAAVRAAVLGCSRHLPTIARGLA